MEPVIVWFPLNELLPVVAYEPVLEFILVVNAFKLFTEVSKLAVIEFKLIIEAPADWVNWFKLVTEIFKLVVAEFKLSIDVLAELVNWFSAFIEDVVDDVYALNDAVAMFKLVIETFVDWVNALKFVLLIVWDAVKLFNDVKSTPITALPLT